MSGQGPLVKINDNIFVNWFFGVSRVHRVTQAEKSASQNPDYQDAQIGDVVIKFVDGGVLRVAQADGADEFMQYLDGISDNLTNMRQRKEQAAHAGEDADRSFGDRFS